MSFVHPVLTLNNALFLRKSERASLPPGGKGYYSVTSAGHIILFDAEKNRVGGINRHGVMHASRRLADGKWWHSYGHPSVVPVYETYRQQCEESRTALAAVAKPEQQAA